MSSGGINSDLHRKGEASGFADLPAAVEEKLAELQRLLDERTSELNQVVAEAQRLQHELKRAREMAAEAAKTRSQFLNNISHEIRTPLNGLIAASELLMQTDLSLEQDEYVHISAQSAQSLLETVNDLLDFAALEDGSIKLDLVEFDPVELAAGVAHLLENLAEAKGLALSCLSAGMDDYLIKPVGKKLLGETLGRWVQEPPTAP